MKDRTLDVNIPKGIRAGQHLRLTGQGAAASGGGKAGDLYLEVEFNAHADFRVDDRDVYLTLPLTPWEAALGGAVQVPTPDGELSLTIPANSKAGRKLRLKGKGIPASGSSEAGDLYAVLEIVLAPAHSEQDKAAYQALQQAFTHFNPRQK
jgi:curved DNA-binding protein